MERKFVGRGGGGEIWGLPVGVIKRGGKLTTQTKE